MYSHVSFYALTFWISCLVCCLYSMNEYAKLVQCIETCNCLKLLKIKYTSTYLLTPWSRVLLEKLTGSAASQEITRIFGTRRFITVPTSARHLSLS